MRHIHLHILLCIFTFCTSCGGQNKSAPIKEKSKSETKDVSASKWVDTKYEYSDSAGNRLIIQNGFPRGGSRYTDSDGEVYGYAIFWTRIINETNNPLELKIDFLDSYEVPSLPGKHFKVLVLPDTMALDNTPLFNYGLTDLDSFLDSNIHKPSSLKRIIKSKEASGFYVLKLSLVSEGLRGGGDILRTGLSLKGQDLFYRVSVYNGGPPSSVTSEKEIPCGRINLKNFILEK